MVRVHPMGPALGVVRMVRVLPSECDLPFRHLDQADCLGAVSAERRAHVSVGGSLQERSGLDQVRIGGIQPWGGRKDGSRNERTCYPDGDCGSNCGTFEKRVAEHGATPG